MAGLTLGLVGWESFVALAVVLLDGAGLGIGLLALLLLGMGLAGLLNHASATA